MTTTSVNTYVAPGDGWVNIAPTAAKWLRVSGYPHTHPFYLFFGSSAPSLVPTAATQTFTFATTGPVANDTIVIGTETYTFKVTPTLTFDVALGADFHAAATNFTAKVNAVSTLVTAVDASDVVTVTAKAAGAAANSVSTVSHATNVTAGGATLAGGTDVNQGILVCHKPFWVNITTDAKCWARVTNPVAGSKVTGAIRLDVMYIV